MTRPTRAIIDLLKRIRLAVSSTLAIAYDLSGLDLDDQEVAAELAFGRD
jgi:hypothetical protein